MASRPVRPTLPFPEPVARPPLRVVYRRLGTVEQGHDGSEHEVTFHYPRVLVRFLQGLRGPVKVVSIDEAPEPQTAALTYRQLPTRQQMQERLGVTGDDDV